jgi:hypothetical protein
MNEECPTKLEAPDSYWSASQDERDRVTNGCGPANSWVGHLVPNWVGGVNFQPACDIHDWMYSCGCCEADKVKADRTLLFNLLTLVSASAVPGAVKLLDREAAWEYYKAVADFGDSAFWAGKIGHET